MVDQRSFLGGVLAGTVMDVLGLPDRKQEEGGKGPDDMIQNTG